MWKSFNFYNMFSTAHVFQVAIELCYHPSCFRNYMNDARILLQDESRSARGYAWHSSRAYSVFKERVIFKKLVKNGKPLRMTRLVDLLKETAREIDNRDISVNTHKLKRRTGGMQQCLKRPLGPNQKTPQQFRKFLMSGAKTKNLCAASSFLIGKHWTAKNSVEEACMQQWVAAAACCQGTQSTPFRLKTLQIWRGPWRSRHPSIVACQTCVVSLSERRHQESRHWRLPVVHRKRKSTVLSFVFLHWLREQLEAVVRKSGVRYAGPNCFSSHRGDPCIYRMRQYELFKGQRQDQAAAVDAAVPTLRWGLLASWSPMAGLARAAPKTWRVRVQAVWAKHSKCEWSSTQPFQANLQSRSHTATNKRQPFPSLPKSQISGSYLVMLRDHHHICTTFCRPWMEIWPWQKLPSTGSRMDKGVSCIFICGWTGEVWLQEKKLAETISAHASLLSYPAQICASV